MADAGSPRRQHWLVAPPLDGPITGGTLYNRFLADAVRAHGDEVIVVQSIEECRGFPWVDSLYLDVARHRWRNLAMGLLAHYLPSVFEFRAALNPAERAALSHATQIICTGSWMRDQVIALGASPETTRLIEPGVHEVEVVRRPTSPVPRAVVVGTVTERKGILPLLDALRNNPPHAEWELDILGDTGANPAYVDACKHAARGLPVQFLGAIDPATARNSIAHAHLLLSASSIESYGMAIAEAQAAGVPVLARHGGHVSRLVERIPSGIVVDDVAALVRVFRDLVEHPETLAVRRAQSLEHRPTRHWSDVAKEFTATRYDAF